MVKKILKLSAIALAIAFIIIQFFQIDKSNPPTDEAQTLEATTQVPPDINMILATSCNDCHTHKTRYPWYAYIQPSGWFLRDHVDHGREHLNFSVWNTYDLKKKKKKMDEICEEVKGARMPLPSYLWIHGDATLTESQGKALCDWAKLEETRLEAVQGADKN